MNLKLTLAMIQLFLSIGQLVLWIYMLREINKRLR